MTRRKCDRGWVSSWFHHDQWHLGEYGPNRPFFRLDKTRISVFSIIWNAATLFIRSKTKRAGDRDHPFAARPYRLTSQVACGFYRGTAAGLDARAAAQLEFVNAADRPVHRDN